MADQKKDGSQEPRQKPAPADEQQGTTNGAAEQAEKGKQQDPPTKPDYDKRTPKGENL